MPIPAGTLYARFAPNTVGRIGNISRQTGNGRQGGQSDHTVRSIGVGRGVGGANDPLWKKIFEIDREIPLTRIFLKIDRENLEFLTKRPPPSANPGYAYEESSLQ
jgi:hypothetical protein